MRRFFQSAAKPLTSFSKLTQVAYLLGYYPPVPPRDGEVRSIRVVVNRPGATTHYRRTFQPAGKVELAIPVEIAFENRSPVPGSERASFDVSVDPRRVTFVKERNRYTARLDLAGFVFDSSRRLVGKERNRLDLTVGEDEYKRFLKERIHHRMSVAIAGVPSEVSVVAYEYVSDRVTTTTKRWR